MQNAVHRRVVADVAAATAIMTAAASGARSSDRTANRSSRQMASSNVITIAALARSPGASGPPHHCRSVANAETPVARRDDDVLLAQCSCSGGRVPSFEFRDDNLGSRIFNVSS